MTLAEASERVSETQKSALTSQTAPPRNIKIGRSLCIKMSVLMVLVIPDGITHYFVVLTNEKARRLFHRSDFS